jgi:hypothetical protein
MITVTFVECITLKKPIVIALLVIPSSAAKQVFLENTVEIRKSKRKERRY